jgi:GINS complex subunit 1
VRAVFGVKAVALLRDAKRNQSELTAFDDEAIQATVDEIKAMHRETADIQEEHARDALGTPYVASNILVHYNSARRNKRCVLALLMHRVRLIEDLRWSLGTTVLPRGVKANLHRFEIEFFNSYTTLLATYMRSLDNLDLTTSDVPPKALKIQVRVLRDFGQLTTLEGKITLQKGTVHFVKRADVENLIRQGVVEHIVN